MNRGPEREDERYAVIASTPRSGTTFMYGVLAHLGLGAGHEHVFSSSGSKHKPPEWLKIEVSGFAGLHPFTNIGPVLHQIREPLKVISSLASNPGVLGYDDPVLVAKWYLNTFQNNEDAATYTYRIEDVDVKFLRQLLYDYMDIRLLDYSAVEAAFQKSNKNSLPRVDLTYDDLGPYGSDVAGLMERFGYG